MATWNEMIQKKNDGNGNAKREITHYGGCDRKGEKLLTYCENEDGKIEWVSKLSLGKKETIKMVVEAELDPQNAKVRPLPNGRFSITVEMLSSSPYADLVSEVMNELDVEDGVEVEIEL